MAYEREIRELLAREAIRDLPVRYCDCVWRDDIPGLVGLFADDGRFTAITDSGETEVRGREALLEFFSVATNIAPRPYIHNHVVELTSEVTASGRCYLDLRSAREGIPWMGAGWYADDYVLTPDGWRFASRRFHALHLEELPQGLDADWERQPG